MVKQELHSAVFLRPVGARRLPVVLPPEPEAASLPAI
jgi:hypothetical protein